MVGNEVRKSFDDFVRVVTNTRVSGHFADSNMQSYICIPHALVSILMYVAFKMDMYLTCKNAFLVNLDTLCKFDIWMMKTKGNYECYA